MATRRYSVSKGAPISADGVTEAAGAAVATKAMEFTFDLTAGLTKEDVIKGLETIENYIATRGFPPA